MTEPIGRLVQKTESYSTDTHGIIIDGFFNGNPFAECVAVVDDGRKPAGIVTRNDYYQKIGSQFGYTIYMKRPVSLIMNKNPLVVDAGVDVNEVILLALKREQQNLYDPVVVTENGRFTGIVSIRLFLTELTKQREKEIVLLRQQQNILKMANEAEIQHGLMMEEKNRLLSSKNLAIRNLLDNAGQGFLSFGEDIVISDEYSYECVRIFGAPVGGRDFLELIGGHMEHEQTEIMREVFRNVFRDMQKLQAKAYLSLLPGEITILRKNILVDYRIIPDSSNPRIMLILTDVTEKKELEIRMARERENLKLVIKAISNGNEISACMEGMRDFFRRRAKDIINGEGCKEDKLFEIYRAVHTFKGDLSQLCMYNAANNLHLLENTLSAIKDGIEDFEEADLLECMDGMYCESVLEEDLKIIADSLGKAYFSRGETFSVSRDRILGIETALSEKLPGRYRELLLPLVRNLRYTCMKDIVGLYNDYLKATAARLDKCVGDIAVTGEDIYIDKSKYQGFTSSLVHIFKNIVDHGIETAEERFAAGKPREGRIECEFGRGGAGEFFVYIRDDGKGIDYARVGKILRDRNADRGEAPVEPSVEEMNAALFMDGFTTKDSVTMISGRGVGLGTVRSEALKLGGDIKVSSVPGKGTEFAIRLPLL